ncbi:uncharacterized protein [Physcomitrium patens]|uniref:uncharacterized protein isoform X1 n=1 Tax=Physcomitrium patens TaxID=3218 RepID=UPI000D173F59|nr:uncharacterized protein LOC112276197 isoform X2 [Physcomitrium patens]|eukprot:XP_024363072.1 uncharacterized protein LOC112276197 isoform X2 [Physcomitrella patens]
MVRDKKHHVVVEVTVEATRTEMENACCDEAVIQMLFSSNAFVEYIGELSMPGMDISGGNLPIYVGQFQAKLKVLEYQCCRQLDTCMGGRMRKSLGRAFTLWECHSRQSGFVAKPILSKSMSPMTQVLFSQCS